MSLLLVWLLAFLALTTIAYYITPRKFRWVVLLVSSWAFYMIADFKAVPFLLFSVATTYAAGLLLGRENDAHKAALAALEAPTSQEKIALKKKFLKRKKRIVLAVVLANILVLAAFKWYNTVAGGLNGLFGGGYLPRLGLLLPLGISFYTFQSVGYVIDIYRGKVQPDKNIAKYALFVSFFPQLIQGPISRHSELAHQLYEPHDFRFYNLVSGLGLALWGYFKKMVIADTLVIMVKGIFDGQNYGGVYIFVGAVVGTIQIYADFSGGVDIARGAAEMLGIQMPQNFRRPYFSETLSEYWRRWHITLNEWWRDYVFYPMTLSKPFLRLSKRSRKLFGNAFGKMVGVYIGIYAVRLINAMWHGANPIYIASGLYYGFLITLGMILEPQLKQLTKRLRINTDAFSWRLFQILRTFLLVCLGKIIVQMPDLRAVGRAFKMMFTQFNPQVLVDGSLLKLGLSQQSLHMLAAALLVFFVVSLLQERGMEIRKTLAKQNFLFIWIVTAALLFAILIFGAYGSGYDASNFVYQQF